MESPIPVLWCDDSLLVIDKPAGVPTLPDGYDTSKPYVVGLLQAVYGRLWVVHRLDRETSGVLLLARTAEAHRVLNTEFDERRVTKTYHVLARGKPDWDERTVRLPLRADGDRRHRTVIDARRGKPAVTHLRVLARFAGYALIEAVPETGRTHQIRAHLAAMGLPIAGDRLYHSRPGQSREGSSAEPSLIARLALHALSLTCAHPTTGEPMVFEAPYPEDFAASLNGLRTRG